MNTRAKFLFLLFLGFAGFSLTLALFLSTNYAKNEWAYFQAYPYVEMASRGVIYPPEIPKTLTASNSLHQVPEKTAKAPPSPQAETPEIQKIKEDVKFAEVTQPNKPHKKKFVTPPINPSTQETKEAIVITNLFQPEEPSIAEKPQENKTIQPTSTVVETNKITPPTEENWLQIAERGFQAYEEAEYEKAIEYLDRALKLAPNNHNINLQLAYAHKKRGENSEARENFRAAIDTYEGSKVPFFLRREVEQLETQLQMTGYVIYRDESNNSRQLGADLTQSQAGVEVSYRPEDTGINNAYRFQVYARILSGMEMDSLNLNPDSYQGGIGVRFRPLPAHNLILSAERLVKVGDFARNDWMLRAGYSRDYQTDYQEDTAEWWTYSLYLDAALITPSDPDIFLTSQVTGGYSMAISEGLVLQPRLTALATWQKDSFNTTSLIEAGPGVNLRYYFNETKYEAFNSYIDLTVEYRIKLSGNSIGGSGPVVSLLVHF